jgi:hypothetical protein
MARPDPRIALLLQILDQAFARKAWHGTTLRGSVRGLHAGDARWRPGPRRHCIWDLTLHTAYWTYVTRRLLTGAPRGSFPRPGSSWPALPVPASAAAWEADVALLEEQHALLREAVTAFPASRLDRRPPGSAWTYAEQIHGVAAHDLYHAGQIQLLKRLRGRR